MTTAVHPMSAPGSQAVADTLASTVATAAPHTVPSAPQPAVAAYRMPREVLTFKLGQEEYGVDILKVQEIRGYDAVTPIANAPQMVRGVINLRGVIVPILDLRVRFGLPAPSYDKFTVVIILNIGKRVVGVVVDGVSDVLPLNPDDVRQAPDFGASVDASYIAGICTVQGRMIVLADMDVLVMHGVLQGELAATGGAIQ